MAKPRASAERLKAMAAESPPDPTLIARFVDRTYHLHGDGKRIVERSPRAGGRIRERILDSLPPYLGRRHRMNGGA